MRQIWQPEEQRERVRASSMRVREELGVRTRLEEWTTEVVIAVEEGEEEEDGRTEV